MLFVTRAFLLLPLLFFVQCPSLPLGGVIDVASQVGVDACTKANAGIALPANANGGILSFISYAGTSQSCSVSISVSSNAAPYVVLFPPGFTLNLASGVTLNFGSAVKVIGAGGNSTKIIGNSAGALITSGNSDVGEGPYEFTGIDVQNAGTGPCMNLNGITNAYLHENVFRCNTGVILFGYYNRIGNNQFTAGIGNHQLWAGILMTNPNQVNSNRAWDNLYSGAGGTGVYISGGYANKFEGKENAENIGLAYFVNNAADTEIHGPYAEAVQCNGAWAAGTYYGLGANIEDSNGNCEEVVTAGTTGTPSAPSWPTSQGITVADGSAAWMMFGRNGIGEGVSIVLAPGTQDALIDGTTGPTGYVLDLDLLVNNRTTNHINTLGNAAFGTPGQGMN